ncbi:MAG: hypothetical protein MJZ63_04750, partial [Muribaculaceae bacterium]|nr:hypothetical protein [Muribaculaceae bacterium]
SVCDAISSAVCNLPSVDSEIKQQYTSNNEKLHSFFFDKFKSEIFQFELPPIRRNFLLERFNKILSNQKRIVVKLFEEEIKSIYKLANYFDLSSKDFCALFGGKRKASLDFYNQVLLPFSAIYRNTIGDSVNEEDLEIKYLFPFVADESFSFVKEFKEKYRHYPMFFILNQFLINTKDRELDIFSMRYALGKFTEPTSIDNIADEFDLSRERVRQLLVKSVQQKLSVITESEQWINYHSHKVAYLDKNSELFTEVLDSENLNISFYAFAKIYSMIFDYKYATIENSEFLIENSYYQDIIDVINSLSEMRNKKHSEAISISFKDLLCKRLYDDKFFINIIKTNVLPLLEIEFSSNEIFFEQNYIDIEKDVYDYLYSRGEPAHFDEICEYLRNKYSDTQISKTSLRQKLITSKDIIPIGKTSTFKLSHWRNIFSGNIRDLIRNILDKSDVPLGIDELTVLVTNVFENTNKNSINASLLTCNDFAQYDAGKWGLSNKTYAPEYILCDVSKKRQSFEERFSSYKEFVQEFQRLPYSSGIEEEEALYRWQRNVLLHLIDVTTEQKDQLICFIENNRHLPSNGNEVNFKRKCNEYLEFFESNYELPTRKTNSSLYYWFQKQKEVYSSYDDNRKVFFEHLLSELSSYGINF